MAILWIKMKVKQLTKIISGILVVSLVFFFLLKKDIIVLNKNDFTKLQNYDVILSNGQSFQSKLLNIFNFSIESYTHIGIITVINNNYYVLHSTPDGTKENGIRLDKLQEFVNLSNVNYYKVIRIDSIPDGMTETIENYKSIKRPFDYDFDNNDKNKIYCSELVFDIFNQNNLIKTVVNLDKPIHPKEFTKMAEFKTIAERKSTANTVYEK